MTTYENKFTKKVKTSKNHINIMRENWHINVPQLPHLKYINIRQNRQSTKQNVNNIVIMFFSRTNAYK